MIAFTATQIPDIEGRVYPAALAGAGYPDGIPIVAEEELEDLIRRHGVDRVAFCYSDVPYDHVMHLGSRAQMAGAEFVLHSSAETMIKAPRPVLSVCAVRTGCGKSQTARALCGILTARGLKVAAIRHPMPYGDLAAQAVQRFAEHADLEKHDCTIEEREEYEPYLEAGMVIYAGVDYERIVEQAAEEADVLLWDGGNNDLPFLRPDLHVVVTDPHRAGHELRYYPGETNLRMADLVVINKVDSAPEGGVEEVRRNVSRLVPTAAVIEADSEVTVADPEQVRAKRVLLVEDGPTLTHGDMPYGAGKIAAERFGAAEVVDPRPHAVGSIRAVFEKFGHLGAVLPAMGYSDQQRQELQDTINATDCDAVLVATPIDLGRLLELERPAVRVRYGASARAKADLEQAIDPWLETVGK